MRKVTVTYTLTSSQEEKLKKISNHLKHRDVDETMQYLMELRSNLFREKYLKNVGNSQKDYGMMENQRSGIIQFRLFLCGAC